MGRDTSKVEDDTNGIKEEVKTQVITENQMINLKLDSIINLLSGNPEESKTDSE